METRDPGALEVLTEAECLALLAGNQVAHVAVGGDGPPAICPVNYVVDGNSIVIRTNWPALAHASLALLTFQIDGAGWSVMVQGVGHDITDALDSASEHLQSVPVAPWAPGPQPRLLRLVPRTISGHRFSPGSAF